MQSSVLTSLTSLTAIAVALLGPVGPIGGIRSAEAQTPLEQHERKVERYATSRVAPARTLCVCLESSGLRAASGRLVSERVQVSGTRHIRVYCSVPLFGLDDQIQQTAACYDFAPLGK